MYSKADSLILRSADPTAPLITPEVRKLMLDVPVPNRLSNLRLKGSDHVNSCYTNWIKIEEVQ